MEGVTDLPVQCGFTASPHQSRPNLYRRKLLFEVYADLTPEEETGIAACFGRTDFILTFKKNKKNTFVVISWKLESSSRCSYWQLL